MKQMNSKIQILFVSHNLPERGAPHHYIPAIWLSREGYDVVCLCPDSGDGLEQVDGWQDMGRLDLRRVIASNRLICELKMLLHLLRLRISFGSSALYYVYGSRICSVAWIALLGMRRNRIIYHTQDFLEPRRHKFYEFFEKRLAKRAGFVIINDENRARFMKSHYDLVQLPTSVRTYLPASWKIPDFDANKRIELLSTLGVKMTGDEKLIMCQTAYSPVRCSENLIKAVALLGKNYYLVFSGMESGSAGERLAKEAVSRHGVIDRSLFLGYLPYTDLLGYTAVCDIGVLLYANDGIGNFYQCPGRLTEYLRCGISVVMSDFPNFRYLALKYRIGVTCDSESPTSIAKAIEELGSRPPDQIQADRKRLKQLTINELCYEKEFTKLKEVLVAAMGREDN